MSWPCARRSAAPPAAGPAAARREPAARGPRRVSRRPPRRGSGSTCSSRSAPTNLPRLDRVTIDPTVIAFTAAAALVSAVDLRPRARPPRVAPRRDGSPAARRPDAEPRVWSRGCATAWSCSRSRSLRPARRLGADGPELHRAAAGRARVRPERRAHLPRFRICRFPTIRRVRRSCATCAGGSRRCPASPA